MHRSVNDNLWRNKTILYGTWFVSILFHETDCSIHITLSWIIQCLKSIAFTWHWDFSYIYGQKYTYRLSNTCYDFKFMHNEVFLCLLWMYGVLNETQYNLLDFQLTFDLMLIAKHYRKKVYIPVKISMKKIYFCLWLWNLTNSDLSEYIYNNLYIERHCPTFI